jgi:hypothetical protein
MQVRRKRLRMMRVIGSKRQMKRWRLKERKEREGESRGERERVVGERGRQRDKEKMERKKNIKRERE